MLATMTWLRRVAVSSIALAGGLAPTIVSAQSGTPGSGSAVDGPTLSSGMSIVTLGGGFDYQRSGDSEAAHMNWVLGYTYLLTDSFALSGGISTNTEWEDYTDTTTWGELEANPILYLPGQGRLRPYVAGRIGLGFGRDDNPASVGGGLGFIYLLGSSRRGAGVGAEAAYILSKSDHETEHRVVVAVGVNFYFR
jgi:hypothetical protein